MYMYRESYYARNAICWHNLCGQLIPSMWHIKIWAHSILSYVIGCTSWPNPNVHWHSVCSINPTRSTWRYSGTSVMGMTNTYLVTSFFNTVTATENEAHCTECPSHHNNGAWSLIGVSYVLWGSWILGVEDFLHTWRGQLPITGPKVSFIILVSTNHIHNFCNF